MTVTQKQCKTCDRIYASEQDFLTGTFCWRVCSSGHLWFDCACKSTLMIPKGKFDWYNPEQNLSSQASSVLNRMANLKKLPRISTSVMQLNEVLQDDEIDTKVIAQHVKKEPVIAAEILQIAENMRSARNPDNQPLALLEHAITYIGRTELKNLVLAASLKKFDFTLPGYSQDIFWEEAFLTADLAAHLLAHLGLPIANDEIYLAACLCNIGKVVAALCLQDEVTQVRRVQSKLMEHANWRIIETQQALVSHCVLGEIGAQFWGFPLFVAQASAGHHTKPGEIRKSLSRTNDFLA